MNHRERREREREREREFVFERELSNWGESEESLEMVRKTYKIG